jgi:hypothetical protein
MSGEFQGGMAWVATINLLITVVALVLFCATRSRKPGVIVVADFTDESSPNNAVINNDDDLKSNDQRNTTGDDSGDTALLRNAIRGEEDDDDVASSAPVSSSGIPLTRRESFRTSRTVVLPTRDDVIDYTASYRASTSVSAPMPKEDEYFGTFLLWPLSLARITDADLLARCGVDGYLYLVFSRWLLYVLAVVTILAMGIAFPVNMSGEKHDDGVRRWSIRYAVSLIFDAVVANRARTAATFQTILAIKAKCGRIALSLYLSRYSSMRLC